MNYIKDLVPELYARLPELELQLSNLPPAFLKRHLPPGVFVPKGDLSASGCINEIKNDLKVLSSQERMIASTYLSEKINNKINILVGICQLAKKTLRPTGEKQGLSLKKISSRQQWLQDLEGEIGIISEQKKALEETLTHTRSNADSKLLLKIKAELGQVEQQLTQAQELLNRAIDPSSIQHNKLK